MHTKVRVDSAHSKFPISIWAQLDCISSLGIYNIIFNSDFRTLPSGPLAIILILRGPHKIIEYYRKDEKTTPMKEIAKTTKYGKR